MRNLFKPFQQFFQLQSSSGLLLILATLLALLWSNSPYASTYEQLWQTILTFQVGPYLFSKSLHFWINEGLMSIFFLIVGLEIKRELKVGELSTPQKAALPIAAALGGMIFPGCIYFLITQAFHANTMSGWGVPTVTDIAFALGILALLGNRVPLGLKVFLTALAIVDDLGAILLIVLFYSTGIQWSYLLAATGVLILLSILNRLDIDEVLPYLLLGILLWFAILFSGIHPTLAGVILAFTIPSQSRINPSDFFEGSTAALERFRRAGLFQKSAPMMLTTEEHQASVQNLENLCNCVQSPLQKLEHSLTPWVSYGILPLFALANAGIKLPTITIQTLWNPISLGIILGLFFGKQIGITLFSWLAVRLKLASLPDSVSWSLIYGASILGGIGFTMSIFITLLAFQQPEHIEIAKLSILTASLLSGIVGILFLWSRLNKRPEVRL